MSHAVVNRNRVKIERLFKARFFISMSRWIDMVEFLGSLYKMKKKNPQIWWHWAQSALLPTSAHLSWGGHLRATLPMFLFPRSHFCYLGMRVNEEGWDMYCFISVLYPLFWAKAMLALFYKMVAGRFATDTLQVWLLISSNSLPSGFCYGATDRRPYIQVWMVVYEETLECMNPLLFPILLSNVRSIFH